MSMGEIPEDPFRRRAEESQRDEDSGSESDFSAAESLLPPMSSDDPLDDPLPESPRELRVRLDPPSGTIVLSRPDRRNALSRRTLDELLQAFDDLHRTGSVRAVILTGGGSSFCAGTDLKELSGRVGDDEQQRFWRDETDRIRRLIEAMLRFPKPIIAAVNGPVRGLGMALLLASDIVVAGESATFGFPEGRLGLVASQTAPLLSFRLGSGQAARLLLTGATIDIAEAQRISLVHERVANDLVWAKSQEIARQCARAARESLQATKKLLNETIGEVLETYHAIAAAQAAAARTTEAAAEGVRAFFEKRDPRWSR